MNINKAYILFLLLFAPLNSFAERLLVPINDQSQPPLMLVENENYGGIYIELFREILETANIQYEFIKVPKVRARVMFENGEVVLSCCGNPDWRKGAKEREVQLFSKTIYHTRDVYVFPKGKRFDIPDVAALHNKMVALKRGYGYKKQREFGKTMRLRTQTDLIAFVARERADVGIVNEDIARHWMLTNGNQIEIGKAHDIADLMIRVHKKRGDLLPRINKAIEQVISSGKRDKIANKYLNN